MKTSVSCVQHQSVDESKIQVFKKIGTLHFISRYSSPVSCCKKIFQSEQNRNHFIFQMEDGTDPNFWIFQFFFLCCSISHPSKQRLGFFSSPHFRQNLAGQPRLPDRPVRPELKSRQSIFFERKTFSLKIPFFCCCFTEPRQPMPMLHQKTSFRGGGVVVAVVVVGVGVVVGTLNNANDAFKDGTWRRKFCANKAKSCARLDICLQQSSAKMA